MKYSITKTSFWGYIGIYFIYSMQGTLYSPGIINQLCQVLMILWAVVMGWPYISPFSKYKNNWFEICCKLILLMYIIYGVIGLFQPPKFIQTIGLTRPYVYLQKSIMSLLPIFMFAEYARRKILTRSTLQILFVIFLIVSVCSMIRAEAQMMTSGRDAGSVQNNSGYLFVALIPYVLAFRRKVVQLILFLALLMFIIYSIKRGAIMIALVCMLVYAVQLLRTTKSVRMKVGIALLITCGFATVSGYLVNQYNENPFFRGRIDDTIEGNDSGRGDLKDKIWRSIRMDLDLTNLVFGRGADATIDAAGNFAHNDWLETFYNNGLVGSILLGMFYLSMFMSVMRLRGKINPDYYIMLLTLFLCSFLPTFFSMSIQAMGTTKTVLIGLLMYMSQYGQHRNNTTPDPWKMKPIN